MGIGQRISEHRFSESDRRILSRFVFDLFGVRFLWYTVTDRLGVAAVLTAFVFAAAGPAQLVKRKSLRKVDREILLLGALYLAVIGLYVLFERAVVNCRPIFSAGSGSASRCWRSIMEK